MKIISLIFRNCDSALISPPVLLTVRYYVSKCTLPAWNLNTCSNHDETLFVFNNFSCCKLTWSFEEMAEASAKGAHYLFCAIACCTGCIAFIFMSIYYDYVYYPWLFTIWNIVKTWKTLSPQYTNSIMHCKWRYFKKCLKMFLNHISPINQSPALSVHILHKICNALDLFRYM